MREIKREREREIERGREREGREREREGRVKEVERVACSKHSCGHALSIHHSVSQSAFVIIILILGEIVDFQNFNLL